MISACLAWSLLLQPAPVEPPVAPPAEPTSEPTSEARAERVVLRSGAAFEGPVAAGEEGALSIDLGFDVVLVPAAEVESRSPLRPAGAPVELVLDDAAREADDGAVRPSRAGPERLWREADDATVLALDDAVRAVGEAVVLVRTPVSLGSGFVIHPEGYLVTNDHVVEGSNELTVIVFRQATDGLAKDEYKKVRIVATAELLDLALLKLETEDDERFVSVPLGDSHAVEQGEPVFAVGNPMGLERSLSEGIVGLRSRLLSGQSYVQTTAALSPGNSGGPLFDRRGAVIGVNSLKIVAQGAEGLSFSIPVNRVKAFLDDQEAYAFDPLNPNSGFRYYAPPEQPDRDDAAEGGR
ncbi:MAG: S1C family serine protease [Planctomycetota bacterium JB042]